MATIKIWIQLENKKWDMMPKNIDRMTGRIASLSPSPPPSADDLAKTVTGKTWEDVTITSPDAAGTGIRVSHTRRMNAPLRDSDGIITDALIFRRYKAPDPAHRIGEWQVPDDRKINPWDINEPNPTDKGTMGTIPGPVIECKVGDDVEIHFRNLDLRKDSTGTLLNAKKRSHSLHVHGFVFEQKFDGAYPLSQEDTSQSIGSEAAAWNSIGENPDGNKKGDRVPPAGTFTYTWKTVGWPSTAGVWLYHDHSFCDMDNINLGAIGMVVIHNTADVDNEVLNQDLPDNNVNGNPVKWVLDPIIFAVEDLNLRRSNFISLKEHPIGKDILPVEKTDMDVMADKKKKIKSTVKKAEISLAEQFQITHILEQGDLLLAATIKPGLAAIFKGFIRPKFKKPPLLAQYLFLFHELSGQPGMCINGRTYLGNTPSVLAGTETKMRFGVVGMGDGFHTFHIHGHRWIIPGPSGTTSGNGFSGIQNSPQNHPVSQFEDTRTFGPANSFVFSINGKSGSFMRAGGPSPLQSKGEWHLHCHVLRHMMTGMMGSLLIKDENESASLPVGTTCDAPDAAPLPFQHTVTLNNFTFSAPSSLPVKAGDIIRFNNIDAAADNDGGHSVIWDTPDSPADILPFLSGNQKNRPMPMVMVTTIFNYHCSIHGSPTSGMRGSITVEPM
jgi:FtsP/CotA-like multicopper oxidase with cupredoxin domain